MPMTELEISGEDSATTAAAVSGGNKPSPATQGPSWSCRRLGPSPWWPMMDRLLPSASDSSPTTASSRPSASPHLQPGFSPLCRTRHDENFHVQDSWSRAGPGTCHTTLLGTLEKPAHDGLLCKKLSARWEKKFGEELDKDLVSLISVENVLHMEGFKEVTDSRMIWVDRLGFDLYIYSEKGVFAARIPFPLEVTEEKGAKSSFDCMSHLAWEVEKNYIVRGFQKVKCLKKIR